MLRSFISLTLAVLVSTSALAEGYVRFNPSLMSKPYSYGVARPGKAPIRVPGVPTERFEVRPGDCAATPTWDDCANDRERAEMSESTHSQTPVGSEGWYSYSLFVPEGSPSVYPTKTAVGQFHQRSVREPPVQFQIGVTRKGFAGLFADMVQLRGEQYPLVPQAELTGRWIDIVVHARWSNGDDGFMKVYVNGKLVAQHEGPTTNQSNPIYFKYGIYRTFMSRYERQYGRPAPTQIIFYSWIKKGSTRAAVEPPSH